LVKGITTITALVLLLSCSANDQRSSSERTEVLTVSQAGSAVSPPKPILKTVTINLAHGRKESINQLLVSEEATRSNLDDISAYLKETNADIVALQEADKPSRWSGNFDHVAYLAEQAEYRYFVHAEHAQIWMGNYGTAILSKWPITEALGLTFLDTPPTASKGFTLARVQWQNPDAPDSMVEVDVISVHLDFSRKSVRLQQIDELATVLNQRDGPLIIMGDFNSEWLAQEYMSENTTDTSRLHVYQPYSLVFNTYKDKRLDWILLSADLGFSAYKVEGEMLSDHKAVGASIYWREAQ
jgi:endonuclease/exonuclease/phosphatase family metal-dependent hydrolase